VANPRLQTKIDWFCVCRICLPILTVQLCTDMDAKLFTGAKDTSVTSTVLSK